VPFEWYYFDVHDPRNLDAVLTIHTLPFNSLFSVSIIDIFIYRDGHKWLHEFIVLPRNQLRKKDAPLEIHFDSRNYLLQDGDKIQGTFANDAIQLTFRFHSPMLNQTPLRFQLLPQPSDARQFNWMVLAPTGEATLEIQWNGNHIQIQGPAYHDANSGNINFKQAIHHWFWAKFYLPDQLLIFGEIVDHQRQRRCIALGIRDDKVVVDEHPQKVEQENRLELRTTFGTFLLVRNQQICVDDVYFYLPSVPAGFVWWGKLLEMLQFYFIKFRLHGLKRLLANTRYLRYRTTWRYRDQSIQSFHEEMWL